MKFFRRMLAAMLAAMLLPVLPCGAEGVYGIEEAGLDLTGEISIRYPVITGGEDGELLQRVNERIRGDGRVGDYLARAAQLLSGGSLQVTWQGEILGDVFSCVLSASGTVENARTTHVWTAANVDLRDGHAVTAAELFTDGEAARDILEAYLEEYVAPEWLSHPQNNEVLPLPETFALERSGLTLLYPAGQLSTLGDRAGDIRIGWHVLRGVLNPDPDGIPARIGVCDMISLSAGGTEKLRADGAEGRLAGIPAKIGDSVRELTDRWHLLTDPDGFEGGRLFSLEGGCFRGVYLMTDDLARGWDESRVQGIRMDQGCLWGLCVGETRRAEWIEALGEPDGTAGVDEEKAEMNRLAPGQCDYYRCGDYLLQLYSDTDGILVSVVLAE